MPERTVRCSDPRSRVKERSLSLFSTFLQARTLAVRKESFSKSPMVTQPSGASAGFFSALGFSALGFSALGAAFSSLGPFRTSSSFLTSMRGKRASPFCTLVPAGSLPKELRESQVLRASSLTPSCSKIRAGVLGMKGWISTATKRTHSARVSSTAASSSRFSGSRPRTQGWVRSMYLLHSPTTFQISARAWLNWSLSICSSTSLGSWTQCWRRETPVGSFSSMPLNPSGVTPSKYFSIMATVRDTRLPRSLARSAFMRVRKLSLV